MGRLAARALAMRENVHEMCHGDQPRLVDFLIIAEHQMLDVGLRVWIGAIEVGLVGTSAGRVVFAELPGATGEVALQLLASLSQSRIVPEPWTARVTNVESQWRALVGERELLECDRRRQRLAAARHALQQWLRSEPDEPEPEPGNDRIRRLVVELLDWAAVAAYLDGELERAQRLLERRRALGPNDPICDANLERLRLRRLDDELELRISESHPTGADT